MKPRKPGFDQLTSAMLQETVLGLRAIGVKERGAVELALAQCIIINSLGGEFWAKECTTFGNKQEFFAQKPDVRVVHLAHMLWRLKDCLGFHDFVSKNDKNNFESTYYECVAAYLFLKASSRIELVIPRKIRGADFDIQAEGFGVIDHLNIEVKARRELFRSEKQAVNFLKSLRSQLPAKEFGAVLCKIELSPEAITQDQLILATQRFLNDTSRVKFVVYCWDSSSFDHAIALQYFSVNVNGKMNPIFPEARQPLIPDYVNVSGL